MNAKKRLEQGRRRRAEILATYESNDEWTHGEFALYLHSKGFTTAVLSVGRISQLLIRAKQERDNG